MKGYRGSKSPWILVIFLIVGAIAGTIIGDVLGNLLSLPILQEATTIGFPTASLDLHVLAISFGLSIKLNILGVVGMLVGIWAYRRV